MVRITGVERSLWAWLCLPSLLVLGFAFLYPLFASIWSSFTHEGRFTLAHYVRVYKLYSQDILFTLGVSFTGLLLVLISGLPVCGYLRLRAFRSVEFLLKIPLFVPFVVVGHALRIFLSPHGTLNGLLLWAGLLEAQNLPSLSTSWVGLAIALAWKHIGLAALLFMGAFRSVEEAYLEAAQNFGAGILRQTKDILIPMAAPSIAVACVLVFASMLASFSIPLMMGKGSGPQMIMIDVYYRFGQHGDYATAGALGVVAYLMASGAAFVYLRKIVQ
ncbi:MAG: sugar ABC transporter permease [Desulfobacterota bacterium]|nr:sugar ABC transporter permease [Thermodesulfobacteriota bacterium]